MVATVIVHATEGEKLSEGGDTVFPFFGLKNKSKKGRLHPWRCAVTAVTVAPREGASRETKSRGSGRAERSRQRGCISSPPLCFVWAGLLATDNHDRIPKRRPVVAR